MSRDYRILTILTLLVVYVSANVSKEILKENLRDGVDKKFTLENEESVMKAAGKNKPALDYWMSRMGVIQNDLMNVQAMIAKDEDIEATCNSSVRAQRISYKRYLICAGSILNRNHVLSSAACIHEATHIRHNIRAPLAVVIAPLKPSIQVIRVLDYKIHPNHHTNPYSRQYAEHNLAILRLACRIDLENFYKIDLPTVPFMQTCNEENCIVAIYRKTGRTTNVIYQIPAPYIPYPSRRKKETMLQDTELMERIPKINLRRHKRKLADPPIFVNRYSPKKQTNDTSTSIIENLTFEDTRTVKPTSKNSTVVTATSLMDYDYKIWAEPVDNETLKSFVVRSSNGFRSCGQAGTAVMFNTTQTALVAVSCDDRQPTGVWLYTDIYENVGWIRNILKYWSKDGSMMPKDNSTGNVSEKHNGNLNGCSTCVFNFFIDLGCKNNNQCDNRSSIAAAHSESHHQPDTNHPIPPTNFNPLPPKSLGCKSSNTIGIDVNIGRGCSNVDQKYINQQNNRRNFVKPINPAILRSGKLKHLPNVLSDVAAKLEQPVMGGPMKTAVKDYRGDKEEYPKKDNSRISLGQHQRKVERPSTISHASKYSHANANTYRRAANEIGLQNIEGDSVDWLANVKKGFLLGSEIKRNMVMKRRTSSM